MSFSFRNLLVMGKRDIDKTAETVKVHFKSEYKEGYLCVHYKEFQWDEYLKWRPTVSWNGKEWVKKENGFDVEHTKSEYARKSAKRG